MFSLSASRCLVVVEEKSGLPICFHVFRFRVSENVRPSNVQPTMRCLNESVGTIRSYGFSSLSLYKSDTHARVVRRQLVADVGGTNAPWCFVLPKAKFHHHRSFTRVVLRYTLYGYPRSKQRVVSISGVIFRFLDRCRASFRREDRLDVGDSNQIGV